MRCDECKYFKVGLYSNFCHRFPRHPNLGFTNVSEDDWGSEFKRKRKE